MNRQEKCVLREQPVRRELSRESLGPRETAKPGREHKILSARAWSLLATSRVLGLTL